jgi:hypothetical protein
VFGWDVTWDQREGIDTLCEYVESTLGIDPDMPLETLKRRLLWGERVEELLAESIDLPGWITDGSQVRAFDTGVDLTLDFITREEA